jgi:Concanavalin A-like lectin/glucanases superfamily
MNTAIGRCGMLGLALAAGSSCVAATLVADYQFHGNYTSAVSGAPDLVPIGTVGFSTASINGHATDVAAFTAGSGMRMGVPAGFTPGTCSIVEQLEIDTTGGYRKLVDFSDLVADAGLYNLSGIYLFYPVGGVSQVTIQPGQFVQIALTRDGAGQVVGYINGAQQFTFDDSATQYAVIATNAYTLFVDDAHTSGQETSSGMVARVRLYTGALSASEVAALTGGCYANCDGSTGAPVLNVQDFTCFFQKFAVGCP